MNKPSAENFRSEIYIIIERAKKEGKDYIKINAGELHRALGGYPSNNHNMPGCCNAMRSINEYVSVEKSCPAKGKGASLTIGYYL